MTVIAEVCEAAGMAVTGALIEIVMWPRTRALLHGDVSAYTVLDAAIAVEFLVLSAGSSMW